MRQIFHGIVSACILLDTAGCAERENPLAGAPSYPIADSPLSALVNQYCVDCHDSEHSEGDINLAELVGGKLNDAPIVWEDVLWALESREMPPREEAVPIPSETSYANAVSWLGERLRSQGQSAELLAAQSPHTVLLERFCISCHSGEDAKGDLSLEALAASDISAHPEIWEKVLRKVSAHQMPPPNRKRPSEEAYQHVVAYLSAKLDAHAHEQATQAATEALRRLTRTEYRNAIEDLLALEIDSAQYLPSDPESHGFDNITVSGLNATLLDRYLNAAESIASLALGQGIRSPQGQSYRSRPDRSQESHVPGLPLGTQGGMRVQHYFPVSGRYRLQVRLSRDRNEHVEGLNVDNQLLFLVDNHVRHTVPLAKPDTGDESPSYFFDESGLYSELYIEAGVHEIGATFPRQHESLLETRRQPFNVAFNFHRHPRQSPAVYELSVMGPYSVSASQATTPSRRQIFSCHPSRGDEARPCASQIVQRLATRAYRRPVEAEELASLMRFYDAGAGAGDFEPGVERALSAILASPNFLFKIEKGAAETERFALDDFELASRLAFFIWNGLPDDTLLELAAEHQLHTPEQLAAQAQRMLADGRAARMLENFTEQWLYLRNLENARPDARLFPDFDDNLRQDMRRETRLFVSEVFREDQSVLNLLSAKYSFINERLARHYGIPHVFGSRFRRVNFTEDQARGGLLRQASILTVTSYATRTSPVVRGHWVLENIVGTPPPPPPPNIPALDQAQVSESQPIRERLAKHREDPACAGCHDLMDPVGFALENFDAVGRWREHEHGLAIDAAGGLPDGQSAEGAQALIDGVLQRPELFARTLTEKLVIFGLGRGLDYRDAATVRAIVADAQKNDYRLSRIIAGIVTSTAFRYRELPSAQTRLVMETKHAAD